MRIFPEMCASTRCPFSSSTRNMAFGNGSTTVPSTRIVSSLGLAIAATYLTSGAPNERANSLEPTGKDTRRPSIAAIGPIRTLRADAHSRERQDLRTVIRDRDGVLEVRGAAPVTCDHGPAVVEHLGLAAAGV